MTLRMIALLMLIGIDTSAAAGNKGVCPPMPPKLSASAVRISATQTPPVPNAEYAGSVVLMAVISDKGYVCDAQVIRGLNNEIDKKAAESVRQWRLEPAQKDK